ncbi:hypothetical protein ABVK25_008678 [Lepraria finkii]|uniref:Uncharacterized protein n=1 Tax=Lepraria finkii TaxID=1340010 RepID=A0ABR4AZR5_9LECA
MDLRYMQGSQKLAGITMLSRPRLSNPVLPKRPVLIRAAGSRPYAPTRFAISRSTSPPGFKAVGSYNTVARRWIGIMVGIPIVFVTSYVLYQRLFLGKEQTALVPPPEEGQVTHDG